MKGNSASFSGGEERVDEMEARVGQASLRGVTDIFFAGTVFGLMSIVYLALLPSDPEGRVIGPYSPGRLALIAGVLFGTLILLALGVRSARDKVWRTKVFSLLYGRRGTVPKIVVAAILSAVSVCAGLALFGPDLLRDLTVFHIARLAPYLVCPVLVLALLVVKWLVLWEGMRPTITASMRDSAIAVLLFVISLTARYPLTGHDLPYQAVWDEVITYTRALGILAGKSLLTPEGVPGYGFASYGDLLVYTTTAGEVVGLLSSLRSGEVASIDEFVRPAPGLGSIFGGVNESGIPLRFPRLLLATINSLVPALIFVALRRFLAADLWASFSGGLIYALFSREVLFYSSYILPDALATTFSLGAILAAMAAIDDREGRLAPYLVCGLFVGLALSVSIRYLSIGAVPLLAVVMTRDRKRLGTKLGLAACAAAGGFLATSPRVLVDLSSYLRDMTSLTWYGDPSVEHRIESLVFYVRQIFSGASTYIDNSEGGVGLGLLALALAIVGLGKLCLVSPRQAALFGLFAAAHLYLVSPTVQRYSRHVLVFYPLVCILAGLGFGQARAAVNGLIARVEGKIALAPWARKWRLDEQRVWGLSGILAFALFLVLSAPRLERTVRYIARTATGEPSQLQMARFLEHALKPGDKVGILDLVPWFEEDLRRRGIEFERIGLRASLSDLRSLGITHVVGTDLIEGEYGSASGTIWENAFDAPGDKIAKLGSQTLRSRGYPVGELYLFAARVPQEESASGGQ